MAAIEPVRAAGLIVYRRIAQQIQYLLMQTSYGIGHWTPPKGHVDPGENDLQTAVRETQEEAGLGKDHYILEHDFRRELKYMVKDKPKVVVYWLAGLGKDHYILEQDFRRELKYMVKDKPKVVVYWLAELRGTDDPVRLSEEHKDYKWLPLTEAIELSGFKGMALLLQECEAHIQQSSAMNT